jgi:two-component system, NarL family, sensor histidine kinase UhpB
MGLETLDLARIHNGALATLEASSQNDGLIEQAELFFKEAITPIEEMHRAALEAKANLKHVNKTLDRSTLSLAASNRSLKQNILRRKTAQEVLKKTGGHSQKLLHESDRLQKHLQNLAHQVMKAREDNRKRISRNLQDEIAQTLLGINVRLLTLRKEASLNAKGFKKDIANTQRLVDKSVKSIKRFAREFRKNREE